MPSRCEHLPTQNYIAMVFQGDGLFYPQGEWCHREAAHYLSRRQSSALRSLEEPAIGQVGTELNRKQAISLDGISGWEQCFREIAC